MAGGEGTRLWPMSSGEKPKQFHSFLGELSLLQSMYALLAQSVRKERILVQVSPRLLPLVKKQLPTLSKEQIVVEPEARDTGPAFAFAAASILVRDLNAVIGFYYSDHLIQSEKAFKQTLEQSFRTAEAFPDHLVLVGVQPLYPHTGLGYMELGKSVTRSGVSAQQVKSFIEKPDRARAKRMTLSKRYLWNTGYKIAPAKHILKMLAESDALYAKHLPQLNDAIQKHNARAMASVFKKLPKCSFEYTVTEKATGLLAVESDMVWSDIGDWEAIYQTLENKREGTLQMVGRVAEHGSRNSLLVSYHRPIVAVGLANVIVVETKDGILVMAKGHSQHVKKALLKLRS